MQNSASSASSLSLAQPPCAHVSNREEENDTRAPTTNTTTNVHAILFYLEMYTINHLHSSFFCSVSSLARQIMQSQVHDRIPQILHLAAQLQPMLLLLLLLVHRLICRRGYIAAAVVAGVHIPLVCKRPHALQNRRKPFVVRQPPPRSRLVAKKLRDSFTHGRREKQSVFLGSRQSIFFKEVS